MRARFDHRGFTVIEILTALGILSAIVIVGLAYNSTNRVNSNVERYVSTKNRVLSTFREVASMPATLRASMLASVNGKPVNPTLLACAGGNPPSGCTSGVETGIVLFSPLMGWDQGSGSILGVRAISSAQGSTGPAPVRVDSFGSPCTTPSADCSLVVYTSMVPQCGPAPLPATPPTPINNEMLPLATCTVADVIQIKYWVMVDPTLGTSDPSLASAMATVSGSVTVSVRAVSGDAPQ